MRASGVEEQRSVRKDERFVNFSKEKNGGWLDFRTKGEYIALVFNAEIV